MSSFFGHRGIDDTQPASTDFAKGGGGKGRRSAVILRCRGTLVSATLWEVTPKFNNVWVIYQGFIGIYD